MSTRTLPYARKPATAMPTITSAPTTLANPMIPRSRLGVPNSPDMCDTSERGHMAGRIPLRWPPAFAEHVIEQLPAFVGDSRGLLDRVPEAHDLARKVFK